MTALRGLEKRLARFGRFERLVLDNQFSNAPTYPPLHLRPVTTAPTDVAEGDVFYHGTSNTLEVYTGSAYESLASLDTTAAQSFSGLVGIKRPVYHAATVLTAADSGALCVFDTAAGFLYTLPTAAVGLTFDFLHTITITSVGSKVLTGAADFIVGGFEQSTDGTYTTAVHTANGSTHRSWNGDGSTTGGYIGDRFTLTAISDTLWAIEGHGRATGTEASPFGTS